MGAAAYFLIHPADDEVYSHDWTDWVPASDPINTRLWTIDSPHGSPAPVISNPTSASTRIAGCVAGFIYCLSEKVTTVANVDGNRSITLRCEKQ